MVQEMCDKIMYYVPNNRRIAVRDACPDAGLEHAGWYKTTQNRRGWWGVWTDPPSECLSALSGAEVDYYYIQSHNPAHTIYTKEQIEDMYDFRCDLGIVD